MQTTTQPTVSFPFFSSRTSAFIVLCLCFVLTQGWAQTLDQTSFITTWKTDNPGSSCNSCITIPTTGTGYNYDVDWDNDGVFDQLGVTGSITYDFGAPGTYAIRIKGDFPQIYFSNTGDKEKILSIDQWGAISWRSMHRTFYGCRNLVINANDIPNLTNVINMSSMFSDATTFNQYIGDWDVSNVTNMSSLFAGATSFNKDIGTWNVSQVIGMSNMFSSATSFNQDIGSWDVGQVIGMFGMFNRATSFNQYIGNWDVSKVLNMAVMFRDASAFNQNIGNWDVAQVTMMNGMFYRATSFNQDISSWTVSNVTRMDFMFREASAFNQDIGNWDVGKVINMQGMFTGATVFNQEIENWNVSSVNKMSFMFDGALAFDQNIGNWDVGHVTDMQQMFRNAANFNQNIANWEVSKVTNMISMFDNAMLSTENYDHLLIGWSSQNLQPNVNFHAGNSQYCEGAAARQQMIDSHNWTITDAGQAGNLLILNQDPLPEINESYAVLSLPAPTATDCAGATVTATTTTSFPITAPGETIVTWTYMVPDGTILEQQQKVIIEDTTSFITTWKTDNLGSSCNSCITIPTTGTGYIYDVDWNDDGIFDETGITGNITHDFGTPGTYTIRIRGDFPQIYFNNSSDKEKILSVDQWGSISWSSMERSFFGCANLILNSQDAPDLSNATSLALMFAYASSFNQSINMWNVSNITNMYGTFLYASSYNQPLNSWNTQNVTRMDDMFYGASSFNQPLNMWNTGNVRTMEGMFTDASTFNQDIGTWNISNVNSTETMFSGALSFNQNIGAWDVGNVTNMNRMFQNAISLNQDIGAWEVSNVLSMEGMFLQAYSFNQNIGNWNVSNVNSMAYMFTGARIFNQDIGNWDVSNVKNMRSMFRSANAFHQNIEDWIVGNVSDMTDMFRFASIRKENYDRLLINWGNQTLQSNVHFHAGNSQYCEGAAARQQLIDDFGWTITDEGPAGELLTLDQENLPDIIESSSVTSLPAPTATNCVGETITATTTTSFPITAPGETIITWTYDLPDGTILEQQQKVIIEDTSSFITTWKTDNLIFGSSCSTCITIPTTGPGYNYMLIGIMMEFSTNLE